MSNSSEQIKPAAEHVETRDKSREKIELADRYEEIGIRAVAAALQCSNDHSRPEKKDASGRPSSFF